MQKNRDLFEKTSVPRALATLAIPTIISQLITMIYNLADTFFIGSTDDPLKVAASSVAFVLILALNCLTNLFGIGGGSLISRLLGEKKDEEAKKVASFSFWGTVVLSVIYSVACLVFMDPILRFLGASDATIGYATSYTMWVVVVGGLPTTVAVCMSHLLRSEGFARQASFGLGMGGILNVLLDPLFMFVILEPGNEVEGAAIATFLSNVAVFVYFIYVFIRLRKRTVLNFSLMNVIPKTKYILEVFAVGFPSAIGSILACLVSIMINNLVSGYGDIPVAAVGIAKKIDMLPMNVGMGLCQGMMPLVAYNYAAKNYKRMKQFSDCARIAGISFAVICIVFFEIFAGDIVRIFINDAKTVELGTNFLRIMCLAVPFMIINFQMSFTFQAMGKGKQSFILSSSRQGIVNIPLMFIMNYIFGLYGIIWTQLISDALTVVISFVVYHFSYKGLCSDTQLSVK